MSTLPNCPKCSSPHTYEDGALYVCPECAHEWSAAATVAANEDEGPRVIKDAVGNVLSDGDTVTVIKDLKIKGSSSVVKIGTKVRNIRLVDGSGGHDIDCKIDGRAGSACLDRFSALISGASAGVRLPSGSAAVGF